MRRPFRNGFLVMAVLFMAGVGRSETSAQAPTTVWDGVYTTEQADRGQAAGREHCGVCHGPGLTGSQSEIAPALYGRDFITQWYDGSLTALANKMKTMPPEEPGGLAPADYADILAYVLSINDFPAGSQPLRFEAATLDAIRITRAK